MNNIKKTPIGNRKIVVYDQVDAVLPNGVAVDTTTAKARFSDGVIPAGTAITLQETDGVKTYQVLGEKLTAPPTDKSVVGLVYEPCKIEDLTLLSVLLSGTARINALPDKEKESIAQLKSLLPRITFYSF